MKKYKNIKKKKKPDLGVKFNTLSEFLNAQGKYPPGTILVYEK